MNDTTAISTDGTFNSIINALSAHGAVWLILGLILIGIFLLLRKMLSIEKVQDAITHWFSSRSYKITSSKLSTHQIFMSKPKLTNSVNRIDFINNPLKTKVFRAFFQAKLNVDLKRLKEFSKLEFKKMTVDELYLSELGLIESMQSTYPGEVKSILNKLCYEELLAITNQQFATLESENCAAKLYKHVMTSKGGYEESRVGRVAYLYDLLDTFKNTSLLKDNNSRVYHFFDILNSTITIAILDAEKIYSNFNGEIEHIFKIYHEKFKKLSKID